MSKQIPFSFGNFDRFDFESYLPGQNGQVLEHVRALVEGKELKNLYLWGEAGTGKSHLLQAVCTAVSAQGKNPAYLPLNHIDEFTPEMLEGLEEMEMVCIDDLDRIAGKEEWEPAVFHLFNRLRGQQRPLLMTAHASPQGLAIKLPDLQSRLAWDITYHLKPLTDQQRLNVLQQRARLRGFDLPDEVADYLIKRVSRDMHSLLDWLDKLDDASLSAKKKLTVPFVKTLLD